jgi:hypothetical protein
MNNADDGLSHGAQAVHDRVFTGLATFEDVARGTHRSERTVYAWANRGLPVRYVGNTPYVIVAMLAEFLDGLGRKRASGEHLEPRRRGRPRKHLQQRGSEDRRR